MGVPNSLKVNIQLAAVWRFRHPLQLVLGTDVNFSEEYRLKILSMVKDETVTNAEVVDELEGYVEVCICSLATCGILLFRISNEI